MLNRLTRWHRKTQIALEYAYSRCSDSACSVFWVHADTKASFAQDFRWIATKLGLADSLDGEELLVAVREQIEALPHWVLILDNADDLTLFGVGQESSAINTTPSLSGYIPRGTTGTVLWTSRDQQIAGSLVGPRQGIHVAQMTYEEGQALLKAGADLNMLRCKSDDVAKLLAELDGHPLAISQAAFLIRRRKLSITEYLGEIQQGTKRWNMLKNSEHDRHRRPQASNSVLETWNISVDFIRQENNLAYEILNVLAFVDNQSIPFGLIAKAAQTKRDDDQESIAAAVLRLEEFSFLASRISEGNDQVRTYDMHKLVQEAILYNLHVRKEKLSEKVRSARRAFQVTDQLFPTARGPETWELCERYLTHAQRSEGWASLHKGEQAVSALLCRVSNYLNETRRFSEREAVNTATVALRIRALGDKHPDTIASLRDLATTYHSQKRYDQAEAVYIRLLRPRFRGKKHSDDIRNVTNLAETYARLGRRRKPDPTEIGSRPRGQSNPGTVHLKLTQLRYWLLGGRFLDTITHLEMIAEIYRLRGKYDEAIKILTDMLTLRRQIQGEKHPLTILNMMVLSFAYFNQGNYEEWESIHLKGLQLYQELNGVKDAQTLWYRYQAMIFYNNRRRYEETIQLGIPTLQLQSELLGEKQYVYVEVHSFTPFGDALAPRSQDTPFGGHVSKTKSPEAPALVK